MMNVKMNALPYIPDYIIESVLGEGGMATVYLGIQQKLQRKVAIKVLDPALLKNKILADRFMIEAQTAANLNHPNIISIYDVGQVGIFYYIVMELLDGSLKDLIKSSRNRKLPPGESLNIISKIAPALDYAHKQGIIHRDIKPDNIMFRQDGTPVLVDFGIARAVDTDLQMTKTGMGIGTPHYMSPEQCQTGPLDGRSDFYSLGVVFYELLTGEKPYRADTILAVALKHIQEPVPKLPGPLARFQFLLDKMMAKNKEERVQNGTELQRLIDEALREPQSTSTQPSQPSQSSQSSQSIQSIQPTQPGPPVPPPAPPVGNGPNASANLINDIENEIHPPIDTVIKQDEVVKQGEIQPIKPVEPGRPEEKLDTIKAPEAMDEIETPGMLKRPRFEDPPVPDWFRESLERTIPVESSAEPIIRKPYKEGSKTKSISRTFVLIILTVFMLAIFLYFFYQGTVSEDTNQDSKSSPRKNIDAKSNIPIQTSVSAKEKKQLADNALTGPGTKKNGSKEANAPQGNVTGKTPGIEKPVTAPAMNDEDSFKNAVTQNSVEAYRKYLEDYPSGRHANEVIARIAQLKEGISLQDLSKKKSKLTYSLRNVYHTLTTNDVESIIKRYGFYDKNYNTTGYFKNDFEKKDVNGNPVIIDFKTGLMWHPEGSETEVEQKRIPRWLKELNGKQYAGYSDWRLPTLEEAASLLKGDKNNKGLYIDPLFSGKQKRIWTGDKFEANNLWVLRFYTGIVLGSEDGAIHYIRPVRSMK